MRWLLLILLALSVPAAAGSAQKVFPNGRRLPGKTAGFLFMTDDVQINLSDAATWAKKPAGSARVTINVAAARTQYSGSGSVYHGIYIPIATQAGVTYAVSFNQSTATRVRVGTTQDGEDLLTQTTANVAGDFTFTFTSPVDGAWVTFDKMSSTATLIQNVTVFRS